MDINRNRAGWNIARSLCSSGQSIDPKFRSIFPDVANVIDEIGCAPGSEWLRPKTPGAIPTPDEISEITSKKKEVEDGYDNAVSALSSLSDEQKLDPKIWGPICWSVLHFRAASREGMKSATDEIKWLQNDFASMIPCDECRSHFIAFSRFSPPGARIMASRSGYLLWTLMVHNVVNLKLNVPVLSIEEVVGKFPWMGFVLKEKSFRPINDPTLLSTILTGSKPEVQVSEGELARRTEICKVCEFYIEASDSCKKCGCRLTYKRNLQSRTCPIGSW